ncbi:30S ribosomal protein S6, partial [Gleimia europaea]|nr:30S ribosomal protein S6 [Gleimia europaea]
KQSEGIYVVVDMTTTPEVSKEINRLLSLNESVMRTKLMRPEA